MEIGIVGLPSAGKSTLFNALTKAGAQIGNFPFTTIEKNVGIAAIPDERLYKLAELFKPRKVTPTTIRFVDIAGLVKGASKGEGLGNMFLSHIREVDAIAHVVRAFSDGDVAHVEGKVSPLNDIGIVNTELILADIQMIEKRVEKLDKQRKTDPKGIDAELKNLFDLKKFLDGGNSARNFPRIDDLQHVELLTSKPLIYVANIDEDAIGKPNALLKEIVDVAKTENAEVVEVCAKIESELAELEPDEAKDFLEEIGIEEPGLSKLIKASYKLLDLITFLTVNEQECRAWTVRKEVKAPEAGGKIHSDFERGFIKAEVIRIDELLKCGSFPAAKDKGLLRLEGKDYTVKDGDVITFKFNV